MNTETIRESMRLWQEDPSKAKAKPTLKGHSDGAQAELKRLTTILREELGVAEFEVLAAKGRGMTIEQAIAYALEDQDS